MVLPGLAKKIGLNEAIILQQIHYWTRDKRNVIDGQSWTYNSIPEWRKQFPFWSEVTIRRTLKSLEDMGLIIRRILSDNRFDSTHWYALNMDAITVLDDRTGPIKMIARTDQNDRARSDQIDRTTSTENKTTTETSGVAEETFDQFWQQYPNKVAKANALKAWRKIKPDVSLLAKILQALSVAKASESWVKEGGRFVPHPATWLNGKRWEDEAVSGEAPSLDGPPPWVKIPDGARWVKGKGIVW